MKTTFNQMTFEEKNEYIKNYVSGLDKKYSWFLLNSWSIDDIAVNLAAEMESARYEDEHRLAECYRLIDNLPQCLKRLVVDAANKRVHSILVNNTMYGYDADVNQQNRMKQYTQLIIALL